MRGWARELLMRARRVLRERYLATVMAVRVVRAV